MSLKQEAKAGVVWTFAQQSSTQIIGFVVSVILARLLMPEDFGTIALFGVVMGVASVIIEGGMTSSLIRTQNPDEADYATVFYFNIFASFVMYGLVFFTAPLVSLFFEVQELTSIIRVYAIVLIISAFSTVQRTRFTKTMDFKTQFKIQIPSIIIGGLIGVYLAFEGFGVWSLVYYAIVQTLISSVQFWIYSRWIPIWVFDFVKFKYHFNFGYKMTLSGLLDIVFNNVYTVIIGKIFSPVHLGFYNRADTLKNLPVSNISSALNKVTFPLFAKIGTDTERLRIVYEKLMRVVIYVVAPILVLMMVLAEPMIRFLFTDKWLPTVPYFQILSIAGILYPIHVYNLNILQVMGRSDLFLKLEVIKKVLIVVILLASLPFGIFGLLWGQVLTSILAFFVNSYYSGKFISYSAWNQLKGLLPSIFLAGFCGLIIYLAINVWFNPLSDFMILLSFGVLFILLYAGLSYLMRFKEISYLLDVLKK